MFLSTKNPPHDPLSSSSSSSNLFLHLTTSSSSSSHELGQSHLSNFSIRDYAYSNRKNSIKKNWPFSSKSLQLLSTHGVTDPLPPFQKFKTKSSSLSENNLEIHKNNVEETRKRVCSQARIIENGLFTSTTSVSKSRVASTSSNKNSHSTKCGGGGGGMLKSKEDSNCCGLVMASESIMASKTCPICRSFSSASNTTLNAHIDQCLSVDAELLPPVSSSSSKPNRHRVKPRLKVKTMVDIYAYAKEDTLEDLDQRNGTKWASVLSYKNRAVVADKSEVSKKRRVSSVGVGPVYIDAKGQKSRVLSEFSEKKTLTTPSREQHEHCISEKKQLSQCSKGNSKSLKKTCGGKKHHKTVKVTNHKANAFEKKPEYQRVFPREDSRSGHRRIYNQRLLAKRGLISKTPNEKGHEFRALRDQPSENDDDSWSRGEPIVLIGTEFSATESYPLKKQKLRNEVSGRSKTMFANKRAQSRSFSVRMTEKEEKSHAGVHINTLRLKKSLASIQEDKYSPRKNFGSASLDVSHASPLATSMRKLSQPFVAKARRRLSTPPKEDEEESGKWEPEIAREHELSDDDYVSSDKGEADGVSLRSYPSSSGYDDYTDDDEESREDDKDNNKRTNDIDAELYHSDTSPSTETGPSERAMYYSEELGSMIYKQTACEDDVRFDSEVGQGSLYVDVDTIPIPGPPGSFLPSPQRMCFDENLGNSSVITSQFQSSTDQLDRNSSESPVSAVSKFAACRMSFPYDSSSFRDSLPSDIPTSYSTTPMSFCVPSHHRIIAEAEPINNDRESCCCQRKERISEDITLSHQASHLLQRRAASSVVTMNLTKSPTCLDPNHSFEKSPYMNQQDLDLQSKFSSRTSLGAAVPSSPSNPVLRLMGKDLMVMNQGEAEKEASRPWLASPTPQLLNPPCSGTGLYYNTGPYLRNSFEATHQPHTPTVQAQTQALALPKSFDHVRYFALS
ncbi:unnamed protein product [Cochlearia groenlandica]